MKSSIVYAAAAAAPLVAALKTSTSGGATVINQCNYEIPLKNVPAIAAGIENGQSSAMTLAANGKGENTFFTPFVQLQTAGGWSIKLDTIDSWTNIMQFEYTWADDNQIWYDMSFVDGKESEHPDWEFVCPDSSVTPHKGAYQHSTDDANGMQIPVAPSATISLILCPGNTAAPSSSAAPTTYAPAPTTTTTPPPPPPTTSSSTTLKTYASTSSAEFKIKQANVVPSPAPESTTEAPSPTLVLDEGVEVVTAYETKVVTAVVTETAHARRRRHEHRHPHGHSA